MAAAALPVLEGRSFFLSEVLTVAMAERVVMSIYTPTAIWRALYLSNISVCLKRTMVEMEAKTVCMVQMPPA